MNLYNEYYAWLQKKWKDEKLHPSTEVFKRKYISTVSGRVLEIGPGAGSNFHWLPKDIEYVGIESNKPVIETLQTEAHTHGFLKVEIFHAYGEQIPIPNSSCDAVIATYVLCSVKSQGAVLREIMRVLKLGGKYIFIEHVAGKKNSLLRYVQNLTNPFSRLWAKNCHVNRETLLAIKNAGFTNLTIEEESIKTFLIPEPQIRGIAYKIL